MNPATAEIVSRVETDTRSTIAAKAETARGAQPAWAVLPLVDRLAAILRFRALLVARRDALARTLTLEVGKPITQSRRELTSVLDRIDFFLDATPAALADEVVFEDGPVRTESESRASGESRSTTTETSVRARDRAKLGTAQIREVLEREPLGVVASISAWNYPYFVGLNVIVPALLAGNAVLYKPSELATLTGLEIAKMLHEAGVPAAVFAPVVGAGEQGAVLLAERIDGVFFTGSNATGKRVAAAVADRMIRVQLELGGKDPVYVADDVDVEIAAASVADGTFYNTGQSCCSVERVYVHERIHDAFVDAFLATVKGFAVGDPMDERTYIGPVARRANLDVLAAQVADATARGATLRVGGSRIDRAGNWFEPTVLTEVDRSMAVMRDETFGPLIGIESVADDREALARMRDTRYGLTAGVYSRDERRAREILRGLDVGSAYWNCCDRVSPRLPWSGRGDSGLGVTLGRDGILAFTRPKAWHLRRGA